VDLLGAGLPQHRNDGTRGGAADDRIVDHDQAPAGDGLAERVQLAPNPKSALARLGVDEGPAYVAVLHKPVAEGHPALAAVALGGRYPRVRDPYDHVSTRRGLLGQLLAHAYPGSVQLLAIQPAVRTRQVNELENAQLGLHLGGGPRPVALAPRVSYDEQLSWLHLAHEVGGRNVKSGRLRGEHPTVVEPAQAEGPEAVWVAHANQAVPVREHEREGSPELWQHPHQGADQCTLVLLAVAHGQLTAHKFGHQVGVARGRAGQHADRARQLLDVGEVAVVGNRELAASGVAVHRLSVVPRRRPGS
jgi:hypothetical protein